MQDMHLCLMWHVAEYGSACPPLNLLCMPSGAESNVVVAVGATEHVVIYHFFFLFFAICLASSIESSDSSSLSHQPSNLMALYLLYFSSSLVYRLRVLCRNN